MPNSEKDVTKFNTKVSHFLKNIGFENSILKIEGFHGTYANSSTPEDLQLQGPQLYIDLTETWFLIVNQKYKDFVSTYSFSLQEDKVQNKCNTPNKPKLEDQITNNELVLSNEVPLAHHNIDIITNVVDEAKED